MWSLQKTNLIGCYLYLGQNHRLVVSFENLKRKRSKKNGLIEELTAIAVTKNIMLASKLHATSTKAKEKHGSKSSIKKKKPKI